MAEAFRIFPNGTVAWFIEASGGGNKLDIDADRNRPAKYPESWFANIKYHSSLDLFEVAFAGTKVISHSAISATSVGSGTAVGSVAFDWNSGGTDHDIYEHSLGYIPLSILAVDDQILYPGMPVQTGSSGRGRYASAWMTTTKLGLFENSSSGASALGATSLTYSYLIFRNPPSPVGTKAFDFDPETGNTKMAQGRFDLEKAYLQTAPGGSPLALPYSRMVELKNGGARMYKPDGTYVEPVPQMYTLSSPNYAAGSPSYIGYDGSFAGGDVVQVQAP